MSSGGAGDKIGVVVAESQPSIRETLRRVVNAEHDMACVGVARSGSEALAVTIQRLPDVLIADADLRDPSGIDVAIRLRRLAPAVQTILYSAEPTIPVHARRARLAGFVTKGAPVDELTAAIRRAALAARSRLHEKSGTTRERHGRRPPHQAQNE